VSNQLPAISKKFYAIIVESQRGKMDEEKMIAVGTGDEISDIDSSKQLNLSKNYITHGRWSLSRS